MRVFKFSSFLPVVTVVLAVWGMAYFIHSWKFFAFAFLIPAAIGIVISAGNIHQLAELLGLTVYKRKLVYYSLAGLAGGIGLGILYGWIYDTTLLPSVLTGSALAAPLIGVTEELIFRGFVQGMVSRSSSIGGILTGSTGHSVYKVLVIYTFPGDIQVNLIYLFLFTFLAGIIFGWMRQVAQNIFPAALAHGTFDIVIYGALPILPGWVWG